MAESLKSCKRSVADIGAMMEVDNGGGGATKEVLYKKRRSNCSQLPDNLISSSTANSTSTSSAAVYTVHHEEKQSSDVVTKLRSTDLKLEESETEGSTFAIGEFRETSESSELCLGDSGEVLMESSSPITKKKPSEKVPHWKVSAAKMSPQAEIDDFFAKFENLEAKRFAEKYNFDIVKDMPLEGRYQWCVYSGGKKVYQYAKKKKMKKALEL